MVGVQLLLFEVHGNDGRPEEEKKGREEREGKKNAPAHTPFTQIKQTSKQTKEKTVTAVAPHPKEEHLHKQIVIRPIELDRSSIHPFPHSTTHVQRLGVCVRVVVSACVCLCECASATIMDPSSRVMLPIFFAPV